MNSQKKTKNQYINREISWLHFNARVLQEAEDNTVPLIERLRFLGIFSNNLDEFFQVRYANVKRIAHSKKLGKEELEVVTAKELLEEITKIVIKLQSKSNYILESIEKELKKENIIFINEKEVTLSQGLFLKDYFLKNVSSALVTLILNEKSTSDLFTNIPTFLMVKMLLSKTIIQYALVQVPKDLDRFVVFPKERNKQYIMLLDDVIRFNFQLIFNLFDYEEIDSHMIKITRDAELDLEEDVSKSYFNKIIESVKERIVGDPVRLVYDKDISLETLDFIIKKMGVDATDSLIPGGRYHNRRDYMKFPNLNRKDLLYPSISPLSIEGINLEKSIISYIAKKDYLQYTPYHEFFYVVKFLREAAIDPNVYSIKITIYRLARISHIVSSLINAAKNGKKVTAQIELQARFDEENNINYASMLEAAGVKLVFGVPGLKVHSKICVVERVEGKRKKLYGFISTGNFNESTAKIYTDYTLFTASQEILKDVNQVFEFLEVNYKIKKYKHLIISPHYTKNSLIKLIDNEIRNAKNNLDARIRIKLNNLTNNEMIDKLYEASQGGVKIELIIRGICCLIPNVKGMSENIEVISIIDKFLEHPRIFIFENKGFLKIYISSADLMTRNIENRLEVTCPIYDEAIQQEIVDVFTIAWNDNVKARKVNSKIQNEYNTNKREKNRSQWTIYDYYKRKIKNKV